MGLMTRLIKKMADEKKLPIQKVKKMAEEKKLPIQQVANATETNVQDILNETLKNKKNKKQLTSVADTTGAGSTLLG